MYGGWAKTTANIRTLSKNSSFIVSKIGKGKCYNLHFKVLCPVRVIAKDIQVRRGFVISAFHHRVIDFSSSYKTLFNPTIRSIWRAILLALASASASALRLKFICSKFFFFTFLFHKVSPSNFKFMFLTINHILCDQVHNSKSNIFINISPWSYNFL